MSVALLVLCALSIAFLGHDLARLGMDRFSRFQMNERLKTVRVPGGMGTPLAPLLSLVEGWLSRWTQRPIFTGYFRELESLIRRARVVQWKPTQVMAAQGSSALVAGGLFYLLTENGLLALISFAVGAAYPYLWLKEKALVRERKILVELPNALEVLSLCSEAGLSLEQAMDQYVGTAATGPLSSELGEILGQARTGSSRKEALGSVAKRLSLTDFSLFTSSVVHAERFGTGVAVTLRQLARTLRDKQSQRAEKAVQEMPVKLLFPLVLFIMPVTFLIIFGPILLQFMRP